ncbi:MAG: DUF1648 domain-containing protein [bacterium]|nr:DUF1648 domain-containing protein [bacterium]
MKNKLLWFFTILPLVVTAFVNRIMPDTIPMHYDASGNINRWGSKNENFIFPVIIMMMSIFWGFFLFYYKKKQKNAVEEKERLAAKNNEIIFYWVAVGMAIMFGIMHYTFMYQAYVEANQGLTMAAIDSYIVTNMVAGLFMIFIGNVLPKSKNNSVAGVRTMWSQYNDQTWAESNRFGGVASVVTGVLIVIETLMFGGMMSTMIMLALLLIFAGVCVWYSYKSYCKHRAE